RQRRRARPPQPGAAAGGVRRARSRTARAGRDARSAHRPAPRPEALGSGARRAGFGSARGLRPVRDRGADHERNRSGALDPAGHRGVAPAPGSGGLSRSVAQAHQRHRQVGGIMTEPKRLLEASPNELTRAVLRAGKSYQASSNARRTTLAALGVAGSSALFAKSAAASTTFKQWIVGGLLGGAVIGAGAVGVTLLEEPSADVAPAAGAPGLSNPAAPAAPPLAASPPSEPPPALQQPAAPEPLPPALEPSNAPAPAAAPPSRSPPAAAEPNSN